MECANEKSQDIAPHRTQGVNCLAGRCCVLDSRHGISAAAGAGHAGANRGRKERRSGHLLRSEERRVGKECRSRWSAYHLKKKEKRDKELRKGEKRMKDRDTTEASQVI